MEESCRLLGMSRQAYHKHLKREFEESIASEIIVWKVDEIRKTQPKIGGRKLFESLRGFIEQQDFKMGRDAFFDVLRKNNRLVKQKRRRKAVTTNSNHPYKKYPNLIRDFIPTEPNQLWVADITYIPTIYGFIYLFLITDAYSHKVVGYSAGNTLHASWAKMALIQALEQLPAGVRPIHHSDRGIQYACPYYADFFKKFGTMSMTEHSDPRENAIAERINGILKIELIPEKIRTKEEAVLLCRKAVEIYNAERLHTSIGYLTPNEAHTRKGELKNKWKGSPSKASI